MYNHMHERNRMQDIVFGEKCGVVCEGSVGGSAFAHSLL